MREAMVAGPLTAAEEGVVRERLYALLTEQTRRYTLGESSSVPVELAEELLRSLGFTLGLSLEGGERARAEEYRPQLEAYSRALSAILNRPVRRMVLWFFTTGTAAEL